MAKKATDKGSRSTRRSKTMPETKPSTAVPPDENTEMIAFLTRWQETIKAEIKRSGVHKDYQPDAFQLVLAACLTENHWKTLGDEAAVQQFTQQMLTRHQKELCHELVSILLILVTPTRCSCLPIGN